MKKLSFLILITLICVELKSQSITNSPKWSSEISIGIGKVGFTDENEFVVDPVYCLDCDYKSIRNEGYEYNFKLTMNRSLNSRNEVYTGFGLNLWTYEVDNVSGWTGKTLGASSDIISLIDLLVGYRFMITELIFIENAFHGELNTKEMFDTFKFSVEPGLGFRIELSDKLQLLPILSYKQTLTNFSDLEGIELRPYSIGFKLAINRAF